MRGIYDVAEPDLAADLADRLGHDLQDESCTPEVGQPGRTIVRWRTQIAA